MFVLFRLLAFTALVINSNCNGMLIVLFRLLAFTTLVINTLSVCNFIRLLLIGISLCLTFQSIKFLVILIRLILIRFFNSLIQVLSTLRLTGAGGGCNYADERSTYAFAEVLEINRHLKELALPCPVGEGLSDWQGHDYNDSRCCKVTYACQSIADAVAVNRTVTKLTISGFGKRLSEFLPDGGFGDSDPAVF
jgi:hypothetical protein